MPGISTAELRHILACFYKSTGGLSLQVLFLINLSISKSLTSHKNNSTFSLALQ
jgi:hypothetical protein